MVSVVTRECTGRWVHGHAGRDRAVRGLQAVVETIELRRGRTGVPQRVFKRVLRNVIHLLSYHLILKRRRTTVVRVAGLRLVVRPTVFHPRIFLTSEFFAGFVGRLELAGKRVADVGTGSGIIALAAARAGAASVVAVDINPSAARAALDNARANGLAGRVSAVCSNLLAALAPRQQFDVILSNPPYFPDEPLDLADRAWNAGPGYRDIAPLFAQARARLAPGGVMYLLISSESDFGLLGALIERAGFRPRPVQQRSILIESLLIYELCPK
jgi:release factor glutamine methyltransferase